jgi:hypothetical protein
MAVTTESGAEKLEALHERVGCTRAWTSNLRDSYFSGILQRLGMPFANIDERDIHFKKYGYQFGASTAIEYEQMADVFMVKPLNITLREGVRPNGRDRIRFDFSNDHFGVGIVATTTVRTYHIIPYFKIHRRGGKQQFFEYERGRTDL